MYWICLAGWVEWDGAFNKKKRTASPCWWPRVSVSQATVTAAAADVLQWSQSWTLTVNFRIMILLRRPDLRTPDITSKEKRPIRSHNKRRFSGGNWTGNDWTSTRHLKICKELKGFFYNTTHSKNNSDPNLRMYPDKEALLDAPGPQTVDSPDAEICRNTTTNGCMLGRISSSPTDYH